MKTIRQHLEWLPPGYKERALANLDPRQAEAEVESLAGALMSAFTWDVTPEGAEFWNQLHDHCRTRVNADLPGVPLPQIPDVPPASAPATPEAPKPSAKDPSIEIVLNTSNLPPHFRAHTAARILASLQPDAHINDERAVGRAIRLTDLLIEHLTAS